MDKTNVLGRSASRNWPRWAMLIAASVAGVGTIQADAPRLLTADLVKPSKKTMARAFSAASAGSGPSSDPVSTRSYSEGWSVDTLLGRLKVSIPLGQMPGEISFPVSMNLDGSGSTTTYLDGSTTKTYTKSVSSTWTPGFGISPFGSSNYILENGLVLSDDDFSGTTAAFKGYSPDVNALFSAYGMASVALVEDACTVNASGDMLKAKVAARYDFGTKYGPLLATLTPNSAFFGDLSGYTLLMDKDRVRVLANCGGMFYPILIADRFAHYVSLEWSRNLAPSGSTIASITRVELRNQRQQGITLRMLDWASQASPATETVADLARLDYANIGGPSALVKGYPSLPIIGASYGVAGRPTEIRIGAFDKLVQPSWSGNYGAASAAPETFPSGDVVSDKVWALAYDTGHEELVSITDPMGLKTAFSRASYATFNNKDKAPNFTSTYTVRGVSEASGTDTSGKSTSTRTMRWNRTFPMPTARFNAATVTLSDCWGSSTQAGIADRIEKFTFGDVSNAGSALNVAVDFQNGFVNTWTLSTADGNTIWASQNRISQSQGQSQALGHGTGLNSQLSALKSSTTTRKDEASTGTQMTYVDANSLQVSQTQALVNGNPVTSKTFQYNNRWAMLEPGETKQIAETRLGAASLAPGPRITTNDWDTANPPLLQLQKTYLDGGASLQHGQKFTYDGEGRLSTQAGFHVEGATEAPAPSTITFVYDAATGKLTNQSVSYADGSGTGNLSEIRTDFDMAHRPTTAIDTKGVTTKVTYDLYGRPLTIAKEGEGAVTKSYPDFWTTVTTQGGKTVTEYRDGFSRVIKTVLATGVIQVPTYDVHSRVVKIAETNTAGATRISTTSYDPLDRKTSETSITGKRVDYTYTTDGTNNLVTEMVDPQGLKLMTVAKSDPWGQVISVVAPNKDTTTYGFDGWGNKTSVTITPAGNGAPQTRCFSYDALARLVSKIEPETGTQKFSSFNALNQAQVITEIGRNASLPLRSRTLVYDGLGRLRSQSSSDASESFLYRGAFLVSTARTSGGKTVSQTFSYQAPGSKLSQEVNIPRQSRGL